MDPFWLAAGLSGLAAALAAVAAFRPSSALVLDGLDDARQDLQTIRAALGDEMGRGREETHSQSRQMREELATALTRLGEALTGSIDRVGGGQAAKVETVAATVRDLADANERRLSEMRRDGDEGGKALREEVTHQLGALGTALSRQLEDGGAAQKERLDGVASAIRQLAQSNADANEALRGTVEGRLETIRQENGAKLEEMRRTVDEKLQGTLEERLGEKFKIVTHHLEQVHRSVGEMQSLAAGVGDLKRVLTNVKTRGTWAEVSLGSLLEQVLAPEQFERNVEVKAGSGERVEYAVRLPGQGDAGLLLPIDAKFPLEDFERLIEASEQGDALAVEVSLKALEGSIRVEGAKICGKYVHPPATTDFAILYLPTEGLYAEVIRRPGLVDHLQGKCRIVVAGPTVLLAILNSLRMGFRTLAIQQRSSEVWQTLAAVKAEFASYGDVLDAVKTKLDQASQQIDKVAVRKRAIDRKLRAVEVMPDSDADAFLALDVVADEPAKRLGAAG